VLDIWCPSIFVSYHRGYKDKNGFYTQELVAPLLDEFEDDVGIDVWSGTLARPTAANVEALKEAIARCTVFVVFLSDAYINAPHCQREFLAAVRSGKFVVPVLLPPHANPDGGPDCGWKGPRDVRFGDWWRDADEVIASLPLPFCHFSAPAIRVLVPSRSRISLTLSYSMYRRVAGATETQTPAFPSTILLSPISHQST